jgi:pimeloyl-ACP methyl ester carboxylesterase
MSGKLQVASGRAMLAVETVGNGEPVVFLHARVADRRVWRHQLHALGATHRAVAYDRRGFGETVAPAENYSAVEDLRAVIESATNGAPAIIVGCSQGGGIVIDAALRYPLYVRGLVLIAPSVTGAPQAAHPAAIAELVARLAEAERSGDIEQAIAIRTRLWLDGPLETEGRVRGEARELFIDMNADALRLPPPGTNTDTANAYERLSDVCAPTLLICGDLDVPAIQARSRYIAGHVARGMFHQLSGSAHMPSLERPDEITWIIRDFINQHCTDTAK